MRRSAPQSAAFYFDRLASFYAENCARRAGYLVALDEVIGSLLSSSECSRHLDVGCGDGRLLHSLTEQCRASVSTGIDISPKMAALCRARGLDVLCGDFVQFSAEREFDLISFEFNSFGYIAASYGFDEVVRRALGLLSDEGLLVFDMINPFCLEFAGSIVGNIHRLARGAVLSLRDIEHVVVYRNRRHPSTMSVATAVLPIRHVLRKLLRVHRMHAGYVLLRYGSDAPRFLPPLLKSHPLFFACRTQAAYSKWVARLRPRLEDVSNAWHRALAGVHLVS